VSDRVIRNPPDGIETGTLVNVVGKEAERQGQHG
jgi:hypothetical protein